MPVAAGPLQTGFAVSTLDRVRARGDGRDANSNGGHVQSKRVFRHRRFTAAPYRFEVEQLHRVAARWTATLFAGRGESVCCEQWRLHGFGHPLSRRGRRRTSSLKPAQDIVAIYVASIRQLRPTARF
jgi:hypothetical protein